MDYTIKYGDTLSGLAQKNGVTLDSILKANPTITDPNKIIAGANLKIPTVANPTTTPTTIQTTTAQRTADQKTVNDYNTLTASKGITDPTMTAMYDSNGNVVYVSDPKINTQYSLTNPKASTSGVLNTPTNTATGNNGVTPVVPDMNSSIDLAFTSGNTDPTAIYNDLISKNIPNVTLDSVTARIAELQKDPSKLAMSNTNTQLKTLEKQKADFDTQMAGLRASSDAENKAAIDNITAIFATRRSQLEDSHKSLAGLTAKAGYQTDAFRYTPTQAEGLVTNEEQGYISKLAELDSQEKTLLLQAASAKRKSDFDLLSQQMTQYDKINDNRVNLISKLLTIATENNKAITAEKQIAAKANALPSSASVATLAKAVAPAMKEAIANMSDADKETYLTEKATALKIPLDVLKGEVIGLTDKQKADAQKLAAKKTSTAKPTATDKKNAVSGNLQKIIDGNPTINGTPIKDPNGFFNPKGFQSLISWGASKGVTRADIIKKYPNLFYDKNIDAYGLSPAEKKQITGY